MSITHRHPRLALTGAAGMSALALAMAPAAARSDDSPPGGGVRCAYSVPTRIGARTVLHSGIPVTVRCPAPATVGAGGDLWGKRVREYLAEHYAGGSPGEALVAPPRTVGAGTTVVRMKVRPWARKLFRRLTPFSVHTGLAVKDADGHFKGFSTKSTKVRR